MNHTATSSSLRNQIKLIKAKYTNSRVQFINQSVKIKASRPSKSKTHSHNGEYGNISISKTHATTKEEHNNSMNGITKQNKKKNKSRINKWRTNSKYPLTVNHGNELIQFIKNEEERLYLEHQLRVNHSKIWRNGELTVLKEEQKKHGLLKITSEITRRVIF